MPKCFVHRNGCAGVWEIFIGQRTPVCGEGGFLKDSDGTVRTWESADVAIDHARYTLGYSEVTVCGL